MDDIKISALVEGLENELLRYRGKYGSLDDSPDISIGTVEPDADHNISKVKLAFIVGAIRKYGHDPKFYNALIEYLKKKVK